MSESEHEIVNDEIDELKEEIRFLRLGFNSVIEAILHPENECNKLKLNAFLIFMEECGPKK